MIYASEFNEILTALENNKELRARVLVMIETKPLCCQAIEEEERARAFREILADLVNRDTLRLESAVEHVIKKIPTEKSKYYGNVTVFHEDWGEQLVRIHLSRFYNHAVLDELADAGKEECFIPEVSFSSGCVLGENLKYKVKELLDNMVSYYDFGHKNTVLKIPEHPHCPHVVKPL